MSFAVLAQRVAEGKGKNVYGLSALHKYTIAGVITIVSSFNRGLRLDRSMSNKSDNATKHIAYEP